MAIRVSPLMGLGAIAQGYEQQRQEAARRQLLEEQLRAQALARAAQGAIGATLTAPGGIGGGVGSSPYAGLSNLGGGGAGGGDPINAPPPGSAPNVPYDSGDSYGNAPKSYATSPGDPTQTADAGVTDIPGMSIPSPYGTATGPDIPGAGVMPQGGGGIPAWMQGVGGAMGLVGAPGAGPQLAPPQPQGYQQPPGAMRNLMPMRPGVPSTLNPQPVPGGYQPQLMPAGAATGNMPPNIQAAPAPAARPPIVPQQVIPPQRPPMAAPAAAGAGAPPQAGGGQQQPFDPADLLNPEKSLQFASQIAMRVKAANPNASNEVIAQATTDLMKSLATQDRLGVALAIANMRNVAAGERQDKGIAAADTRQNKGLAAAAGRQQTGIAAAAGRQQAGFQHSDAQLKQRLEAQQARYKQMDAQKEQARKDAMSRGDRSAYIRVITAQLHELQSELGNMMRTADMSDEEKQAAQAKVKELTAELARVQGQTRPQ